MAKEKEIMKVSVDTGSIIVEIEDMGEVLGSFRFNPNDPDIIKRFEQVGNVFSGLEMPETVTEEVLFDMSNRIKEQFDYLLNYKVADDIFSVCNPLTLTRKGDFYCENILDVIAEVVEKTMDERIKKKEARIKRATAKYHK